jgi:hypothetical protein
MKVLLRQSGAQFYYAGPRQWTQQAKAAFDFGDVERAITASRDEELTGMEVVLSFEDGCDDPCLPLPPGH